jgi:DMSO/TMAO reductase YedYZ molybdopterin-dependent catalytic subunit
MMKRIGRIGLLGLVCLPLLLGACAGGAPGPLASVEIRQYEGQDLSSIYDFRENSIRGPQDVLLEDYRMEVTGLVERPLSLTYDQVLELDRYSKVVTLHCVEGWSVTILWEGVLIEDLLDLAGVQDDAVTVIFHAEDGYTSSLSLDFIGENDILLAYEMNEVVLPAERGFPFQVVAESKWGYKWVKWVTEIELSADADYAGYWESRGFNDDGDISGSMFD